MRARLRLGWTLALTTLVACAGRAPPIASSSRSRPQSSAVAPVVIDAGRLRLTVSVSRTAQLFHVVDQLSGWSEFCHGQYRRWAGAWVEEPRERSMLTAHAAIRSGRGWGGGFEQAWYVDDDLETAAARAIAAGDLSGEEARIELEILRHFAARIDPLIVEETARLTAFAQRVAAHPENLRTIASQLARLVGLQAATLEVRSFLMANPSDHDGGGGMNGGRLVLEVPRRREYQDTLVHEVLHAFLATRESDLEHAAASAEGLSLETLNEGIAYALSPGLIHSGADEDPLARTVAADIASGLTLANTFARYNRLALALRPALAAALRDGTTLESFLPQAVAAWNGVRRAGLATNTTTALAAGGCARVDDASVPGQTVFPYLVPFQSGRSDTHDGDRIVISEVRGTRARFEPDGMYLVRGSYVLASAAGGTLELTVVGGCTEHNPRGRQTVTRGNGNFTLAARMAYPGQPHVWFSLDGQAAGGTYFGSGESLRQ